PASKPTSKARRSLRSTAPPTPSQIPLPPSRSISPPPLSASAPRIRDQRSPKRTFDESSGSSEPATQESHKRSKHSEDVDMDDASASASEAEVDAEIDADVDADDDTPALSSSLSTTSSTSSSPSPPPPPVERPLTRRQRKALGLPKPRPAVTGTRSAGKIVIPGGRFRKTTRKGSGAAKGEDEPEEEDGEWQRNGTGRMDVRGFRELRI
ncbi:hypothetical protein EVG20_g11283, partial [Dentipellis fragilis]